MIVCIHSTSFSFQIMNFTRSSSLFLGVSFEKFLALKWQFVQIFCQDMRGTLGDMTGWAVEVLVQDVNIFSHRNQTMRILIKLTSVILIVWIDSSRFPSLGIPRLELENPRWNSYVGHWNSYVGIPMSNVGIPTWVFSFLPRFLPNLMIFIIGMNLSSFIGGIPMSNIGIPTWVFQVQPRNSKAREPTTK